MIKCCSPYKGAKLNDISQGFILKVHEANDWVAKYGTFLVAPFNAKVNVITGAGDKLNTSEFELE
ncbi:hypothetical protein M1146_05725, partial [Patescibacteria group bacterium]|nr:hypothetical protein [Patescibacteria group bacterium]